MSKVDLDSIPQFRYKKTYNDRHLYEIWSLFNLLFARLRPSEISPVCIHNRLSLLVHESQVFFLVAKLNENKKEFRYIYCSCSDDSAIKRNLIKINSDYNKYKLERESNPFCNNWFAKRYPLIPAAKRYLGSDTAYNTPMILCIGVKKDSKYLLLNEHQKNNKLLRKLFRFIDKYDSDKDIIFRGIRSVFNSYNQGKNTKKKEFRKPLTYKERRERNLLLTDKEIDKLLEPVKESLDEIYSYLERSPIFSSQKIKDNGDIQDIPYRNIFFYFKTATNIRLRGSKDKEQYDFETRRVIPKNQAKRINNYFQGGLCSKHIAISNIYDDKISICKREKEKTLCIVDIRDYFEINNKTCKTPADILSIPFKDSYSFTDDVFNTGGIIFDYYDEYTGENLTPKGIYGKNKSLEKCRLELNRCVLEQLTRNESDHSKLTIIPITIGGCPYGAISFVSNSIKYGRYDVDDHKGNRNQEGADQIFLDTISIYRIVRTFIVKQLERDIRIAYLEKIADTFERVVTRDCYLGNKLTFPLKALDDFCQEVSCELHKIAMVYPYDYVSIQPSLGKEDNNYINIRTQSLSVKLKPSKLFLKLTDKKYIKIKDVISSLAERIDIINKRNREKYQKTHEEDIRKTDPVFL